MWDVDSFWAGEPVEVAVKGRHGGSEPLSHFAHVSLPSRCSSGSFIVSFHKKFINNKETVFLSSVSHFCKLIESEEGVVGTFDL